MQFQITVLMALFAAGTPVLAAPTPFGGLAVPKKSTPSKGNPIKNAVNAVGNGAAACLLGALLCGKIAGEAIRSGTKPTIKTTTRDLHVVGGLEARSLDPEYVTVVTRSAGEEADESAGELADEEADE